MTVCIGMIDHKTKHVWMAADSQLSGLNRKQFEANESEITKKIFRLRGTEHCYMAGTGCLPDLQTLAMASGLASGDSEKLGKIDDGYVFDVTVPAVFSALRDRKRLMLKDGIESMDSMFLMATADSLGGLWDDGGVTRIRDAWSIGAGEEQAIGALSVALASGMGPREALISAVKAASETGLYCGGDILIVDATDGKEEIVGQG